MSHETWMDDSIIFEVMHTLYISGLAKIEVELLPTKLLEGSLIFALPDTSDRFAFSDFPIHLPLELLGVEAFIQVNGFVFDSFIISQIQQI